MATNGLHGRVAELEAEVTKLRDLLNLAMRNRIPDSFIYRAARPDELRALHEQAEQIVLREFYRMDEMRYWADLIMTLTEREYIRMSWNRYPAWRTFYWLMIRMMEFAEQDPALELDHESAMVYRSLDMARRRVREIGILLLEVEKGRSVHDGLIAAMAPIQDPHDLDSRVLRQYGDQSV